MAIDLETVLATLSQNPRKLPPVHLWQPEHCGEIDIEIDQHMQWFHEGRPFERHALVKLLSGILRREGDEYYLVTPQEKMRIRVADVPFEIIHMQHNEAPAHQKVFVTNSEDVINLDQPAQWQLRDYHGTRIPYVHVRDGLWARVHRNVFYQMVEAAEVIGDSGKEMLYLPSNGHRFLLGSLTA